MPRIRVLAVDDSALMRRILREIVESTSDLELVGVASSGQEALAKIRELKPDVVTLDVQMPGMDGLQILEQLMRESPLPVVMLSYLTQAGAETTLQALMLGAVDAVAKPSGPISLDLGSIGTELVDKIRVAARARVRRLATPSAAPPPAARPRRDAAVERLVVIGSSTGGPQALSVVVPRLPALPGVAYLLVQHMPAWLTPWLVQRLAPTNQALEIREATEGSKMEPGVLLVAPGDYHLRLQAPDGTVHLDQGPRVLGVRPSVNVALFSAAEVFGRKVLTAILTGSGEDGADGAAAVRRAGGGVIAEDKSTCVVWGKPRAVTERGLAQRVVPVEEVAGAIQAVLTSA